MKLNKFLEDLANNTPNEKQFEKQELGKKQRINRKRRNLQTLQRRNTKYR